MCTEVSATYAARLTSITMVYTIMHKQCIPMAVALRMEQVHPLILTLLQNSVVRLAWATLAPLRTRKIRPSTFSCLCSVLIAKHTHTFNGPFSGTSWVSRYQKGKTNLDFTEARDSEWQWHQLGHM